MTNKVFDVEAPEAVLREAAGEKKAPAVVYGGICNWDAEDLVDARETFDKIIWTPSAHGSFLVMLVLATLPQNCMLPVSKALLSHERAVDATPSTPQRILRRASRPAPSARRRWCRRRCATPRRTRDARAPRRWRGFWPRPQRGLDALRAERRHRRYFTTLSHHVALLRADGRPLAGGATQFAAIHAKASYLEQVQGYGRSGEKTLDDGIQRHDLFDVLEPRDPALELSPFDMIKRALCSQPGLHTPGESVESKVTTGYKSRINWNEDASVERADEVNALVVNFLPLLATESPRTIVMAAPALKYAADTHLLLALGGKTKANDFAVVDKLPKKGNLGPGGVHQVAVRTRTGGTASAPQYTYQLHTYQKKKYWRPTTSPSKALGITFDLLVKLLECGHLPEGALPASLKLLELLQTR